MASRITSALPVVALGAALFAMPAAAQFRGGGMRAPVRAPIRPAGPVLSFRGGSGRGFRGERRSGRSVYLPLYSYPYYPYEGYDNGTGTPPASPPVVVVNPPQAPAPTPPAPPVESLLLEYHDGQWVRVPTGEKLPEGPLSTQPEAARQANAQPGATAGKAAQPAAPAQPNTILVFRDGHREEISSYVIHGDSIDVRADYWTTGSWTKRMPISQLNVPETIKVNAERGVKFNLPSGPDEVVVGF